MKLSGVSLQSLKSREKTYRLFDGGGLYLEVSPSGGKWWRLKYRYQGKDKRLALGAYPAVTLADARDKAEAARALLAHGGDPADARKAEKARLLAERTRATAEAKASFLDSRVCVVADLRGMVEIWKGDNAVILSLEEAGKVCALLQRLVRGMPNEADQYGSEKYQTRPEAQAPL